MPSALPIGFLTLPGPGDPAAAQLGRRLQLLALRRLMIHPLDDFAAARRASMERLRPVLERVQRAAPDKLLAAVGSPDVLAPVLCVEAGQRPLAPSFGAAVPALILALHRRGALLGRVDWEGDFGPLLDERGAFRFGSSVRTLHADERSVEVELEGGTRVSLDEPSLRPFHPIALRHPRLVLSELDTNPLAHEEAHPDKSGNAIDLGGRTPADWVRALDEALALIDQALPSWSAELTSWVTRFLPVGFDAERHLSASYREAPGIAYLTLHPDPLTMAEAIVHETQHNKLNVLSWFDPVLENGYTEFDESPVRPDLRPLMGVLLAAHAFVPVAALGSELVRLGHPLAKSDRLAQVIADNERALAVVRKKGKPTATGRLVIEHIERLHAAVRGRTA